MTDRFRTPDCPMCLGAGLYTYKSMLGKDILPCPACNGTGFQSQIEARPRETH